MAAGGRTTICTGGGGGAECPAVFGGFSSARGRSSFVSRQSRDDGLIHREPFVGNYVKATTAFTPVSQWPRDKRHEIEISRHSAGVPTLISGISRFTVSESFHTTPRARTDLSPPPLFRFTLRPSALSPFNRAADTRGFPVRSAVANVATLYRFAPRKFRTAVKSGREYASVYRHRRDVARARDRGARGRDARE